MGGGGGNGVPDRWTGRPKWKIGVILRGAPVDNREM